MENMGEMAEQQSLSEPLPESVDSPAASTHAGLSMSPLPTEHSPTGPTSRSTVARSLPSGTAHESLGEAASVLDNTHLEEDSNKEDDDEEEEEEDLVGNCSGEELSGEEGAVSLASPGDVKQGLSVIVQPHDHDHDHDHDQDHDHDHDQDHDQAHDEDQDDSHDSELLSPGKLSPTSGISVSVASMIDATDFRSLQPEPTYQTLTSVNGRMSPPGFSPSSSYATLTPLQPLPPISTMSDKFAYGHASNVSGSFTVMQNNGLGNIGLGMGVNSPYSYDKLPSMGMSPPHHYSSPNNGLGSINIPQQHSPLSPQSSYSQNGLQSPQKSMSPNSYDSPYTQRDLVGRGTLVAPHSPNLSPPSASLHSPPNTIVTSFGGTVTSLSSASLPTINGLTTITPHGASLQISPHHSPPSLLIQHIHRDAVLVNSPSPPSFVPLQQPSTPLAVKTVPTSSGGGLVGSGGGGIGGGPGSGSGEVEEINTKELAQRISAELKRYSIPQAIFAQRVLCRSQGTLSDLLRNPKPWSKLKSGRETFRRMWKWLQEPEFQRMSALRLAGSGSPSRPPSPRHSSSPDLKSVHVGYIASGINGKCWNSADVTAPWDINTVDFNYVEAAQIPQRGTCKRKEDPQSQPEHTPAPKKPRLVFTDLQRRTLQAIFKETKRPSKEMQVTIARQLGLEPTTVGNFFMNARRRSMDKWKDEDPNKSTISGHDSGDEDDHSPDPSSNHGQQMQQQPDVL